MHTIIKVQIQPEAQGNLETLRQNLREIERLRQENADLLRSAVRFYRNADSPSDFPSLEKTLKAGETVSG